MPSSALIRRPGLTHCTAVAVLGFCLSVWVGAAQGDELPSFDLTIRDHQFEPDTLTVPAGTRFKLVIRNADPTPEEFESYELNREKVIRGNSEATIYVGPLDPGTYPFFGEFNEDTARGQIIVE